MVIIHYYSYIVYIGEWEHNQRLAETAGLTSVVECVSVVFFTSCAYVIEYKTKL